MNEPYEPHEPYERRNDYQCLNDMKEDIAEIKMSVAKLDESIRGNGKPGILSRLTRIELVIAIVIFFGGLIASKVIGAW